MQPSKPVHAFTDAELLARSHRRRRWTVRIVLIALATLLLLVIAGLALTSSSGLSIEQAKECFKQLQGHVTKEHAERVLGKPLPEQVNVGYKQSAWIFTKQSFDRIECYAAFMIWDHEGKALSVIDQEWRVTGAAAWKFRWWLLKTKLGFNKDEWP